MTGLFSNKTPKQSAPDTRFGLERLLLASGGTQPFSKEIIECLLSDDRVVSGAEFVLFIDKSSLFEDLDLETILGVEICQFFKDFFLFTDFSSCISAFFLQSSDFSVSSTFSTSGFPNLLEFYAKL